MKKTSHLSLVLIVSLFSTMICAKSDWPVNVGLTFGLLLHDNAQDSQIVAVTPASTNEYDRASAKKATLGMRGITLAYLFKKPFAPFKQPDISVGIGIYKSSVSYAGTETPGVNYGDGDTLNYSYDDSTLAILAESKLIYHIHTWQPYFLFGFGTAFIKLSDYKETPTDPHGTAAPSPALYNNHSSTDFTYEFGLGVQKSIVKHLMLAADIRKLAYSDAALSAPSGQYYNKNAKLHARNLGSLSLAMSLIYQF